jgi:hypothetical protein
MPTFDAKNAQCHVFTEKEGLLSAMAHDLQIAVTEFTVNADEKSISATFNSSSFKVMNAMKDGQPTTALSDKDKKEIEGNIVKDVLGAGKNPEIKFVSTSVSKNGESATIAGNLTLNGTTKAIQVAAKVQGGSFVAEVPIHQPDFGIKPYSAMMGTLKIKPALKVRITLPKF